MHVCAQLHKISEHVLKQKYVEKPMRNLFKFVVFFVVLIYCSYAYLFFFSEGIIGFKPLYWYFITIILALFLVVFRLPTGVITVHTSLTIWLLVFLCDSIVCFLYSPQGEIEVQALIISFQMTVLLFSFSILFQVEGASRISGIALLLVIFFSVLINFMDFIAPMWSKVPGRAAGMYANPNISGTILVLAMIITTQMIPRNIRLLFCVFVGLGVFVTFSRGSWLFWVLAIIGLAFTGYLKIGRKDITIAVGSLIAGIVVYAALTGGVLNFLVKTGFDEYLTPNTYTRLGGTGTAFADNSTASRANAAAKAWAVFAANPWLGSGLGVDQTWSVGAHNTYLRMAAEGGFLRLGIFVWLLVILWRLADNKGRVALVVYAAMCLVSHDNLQQPALLVILALIACTDTRQKKKLHKRVIWGE